MRALIYLRVSTDEQAEEGFSLDAQRRLCQMYAELRGWSIAETDIYVDDGYSGRNAERPALQRMLKDIERKRPQAIVVHKLDRLARNLELMLSMVNDWDRRDIAFASAFEQMDFSTPFGRLILNILGGIAQWFSDNLAGEVKKGLLEKARQGGWVGPCPYGYTLENGVLVVNEDERPVVVEIFERYATSRYSYSQIAELLNARGLMLMDWKRSGRHPFGEYSVRSILDNRAYLGLVSVKDTEFRGKHQAIIDQALWDRVRDVRGQRSSGTVRNMEATYAPTSPYNGLVYCVHCGSHMHWHPKHPNYLYYRCSGVRGKVCTMTTLAAYKLLDQHVHEQLQALVVPDEHHNDLAQMVVDLNKRRHGDQPTIDRGALEAKLKRLARIYADGHMDDLAYERERAQLLDLLRDDMMPAMAPTLRLADIKRSLLFLTRLPNIFAIATPEEKAALLRELFAKLWVEKGRLKAITPTPLYLQIAGVIGYVATPGRVEAPSYPIAIPLLPIWLERQTFWTPEYAAVQASL